MFLTVVLVKVKNGMLTFRWSTDARFYPIVRAKLRQPELKSFICVYSVLHATYYPRVRSIQGISTEALMY